MMHYGDYVQTKHRNLLHLFRKIVIDGIAAGCCVPAYHTRTA